MQRKRKAIKFIIIFIILFILSVFATAEPFLGSFIYTYNYFENDKFITLDTLSFYLDHKINDHVNFYTRLTAGFKCYAEYADLTRDLTEPENKINFTDDVLTFDELSRFSFIPNIDLFYFEFRSGRNNSASMNEEKATGETNYDLFNFKLGRIHVTQGLGFFLNMKGDGIDTYFTLSNFRFRLFGITNSFDTLPFFNFIERTPDVVFTNWDTKRYPVLSNRVHSGNIDGFISNITSQYYNFYFANSYDEDYTSIEKGRLNSLRYAYVLAGRVFTGFSLELMQVFFQNFSLNFMANIDLVPRDFIITFPSRVDEVSNTFGGKYTSFYTSLNASGKIVGGLYYNFEAVYETGFNATYFESANYIDFENKAIHSFALNSKLSYFFYHPTKPTIHIEFLYAHGDEDVEFNDDTIVNKEDYDYNYRSPTSPQIGYAFDPNFSNLIVLGFSQTIKPFAVLKNDIFSRFSIESVVLLYLRPIVGGSSFLSEKTEYQREVSDGGILREGLSYRSPDKAYLGVEFDLYLLWALFSDLKLEAKGGVFLPNGYIYIYDYTDNHYRPFWRAGLSLSISF